MGLVPRDERTTPLIPPVIDSLWLSVRANIVLESWIRIWLVNFKGMMIHQ